MKMMMKKMIFIGMLLLTGTAAMCAEETNVTSEVDTVYIKLDANLEPINFVNSTKEELEAAVGELETLRRRLSSSTQLATIPTRLRMAMSPRWQSRLPTTITTRSSITRF